MKSLGDVLDSWMSAVLFTALGLSIFAWVQSSEREDFAKIAFERSEQGIERWGCRSFDGIVVLLARPVGEHSGSGAVWVSEDGFVHAGRFEMKGINREWYVNRRFFTIEPAGAGLYEGFGYGREFHCEKSERFVLR